MLKRIEREAAETLSKTASLYTSDRAETSSESTGSDSTSEADSKDRKVSHSGERLIKSGSGTKGENVNDPGAELWGVGKSKL